MPLPLALFGGAGGEAHGIAIDWVTGWSGFRALRRRAGSMYSQATVSACVCSRRERCSVGTAPLNREVGGNIYTPELSGALVFVVPGVW